MGVRPTAIAAAPMDARKVRRCMVLSLVLLTSSVIEVRIVAHRVLTLLKRFDTWKPC